MQKIIIYGAGQTGKIAYDYFASKYDCLFFVDSDKNKWGKEHCGKKILKPEILTEYRDTKLIIASIYAGDILKDIKKYGIRDVFVYTVQMERQVSADVKAALDSRAIDLGAFFMDCQNPLKCKALTFIPGGS